jgi:hypothetical protein
MVGPIATIPFDPGHWCWVLEGRVQGPLLGYSAQLGRKLLNHRKQLSKPIPVKWYGLLPPTYKPRWKDVWLGQRPRKDAAFIWSIFHHTVAVNAWRAHLFTYMLDECTWFG